MTMETIGPRALETMRAICSVLPESIETMTFGHPTFQAGKKRTFVVLDDHEQRGMLGLGFKANRAEQIRPVDGARVFPFKFDGKTGGGLTRVDGRVSFGQEQERVVVR